MSEVLLPMLYRAGTRIYSHFKAVTQNGASPYGELSSDDIAELTGYKRSMFIEIGRPCIALGLFDLIMGTKIISNLVEELPAGKLSLSSQRALRKATKDAVTISHEELKKCKFYSDIAEWLFPSVF